MARDPSPHPDRAGDGQDEVRLVAITAAHAEGLRLLATFPQLSRGNRRFLEYLADTYEDGITEEEARRLHNDLELRRDETTGERKLREFAFPTQKDSGDD